MSHNSKGAVEVEDKVGLMHLFSSLKLFRNHGSKKGKGNGDLPGVKCSKVKVSCVLFSAIPHLKMW